MKRAEIASYLLMWMAYIAFSMALFPFWNTNANIPVIILVAMGAWLFGTRRGLALMIPSMVYHYILYSHIHTEKVIFYETPLSGTLICIIIAILAGKLKVNLDAIRESNIRLNGIVDERNMELATLSGKLIDNTEKVRSERGQALHDGIGQQLTGIQLYCSSLADQLDEDSSNYASLAHSLEVKAKQTHNIVRRISRTLFPVRIGETGLDIALDELAACLAELHKTELTFTGRSGSESISGLTALQVYRICQETVLCLVNRSRATKIEAAIETTPTNCHLQIRHDGAPLKQDEENLALQLIRYRLQRISGHLKSLKTTGGMETLVYKIPLPETGESA